MNTAEPIPAPVEQHRQEILFSAIKSLLLPALLLLFFLIAPGWWNAKVRDSIIAEVFAIPDITQEDKMARAYAVTQMNFQQLCREYPPYLEQLHQVLVNAGVCAHFQRLEWGLLAAQSLAACFVAGLAALFAIRHFSRRSRNAFANGYRDAWQLAIILSLINVAVGIPLLAFALFEFTALLAGSFLPGVLIFLLVGAVVAIWLTVKPLLARVPLEFTESLCREVKPDDSPALWNAVESAASRLGTHPPDHILVGMQLNFYVTELAVRHGDEVITGKTLFLSWPLLKHLPEQEVIAIIGHELGHFIGKDTVLTRRFFPLRQKVHAVVGALAQAGWVGLPSIEIVKCFWWMFEGLAAEVSRSRELLADSVAAELTSPETQASALARLHIIIDAFVRRLRENLDPLPMPTNALLSGIPMEGLWPNLLEIQQTHPLDSHPPLRERLSALSVPTSSEHVLKLFSAAQPPASEAWFHQRESLFIGIIAEAQTHLDATREQNRLAEANLETADGRRLLEDAFPALTWKSNSRAVAIGTILLGFLGVLFLVGALAVPDWAARLTLGPLSAGFLFAAWRFHRRHWNVQLLLDCEGLFHTAWKSKLPFSAIGNMILRVQYGQLLLQVTPAPSDRKTITSLLPWATIRLGLFQGQQQEIAETIFRYYHRQMPPPQPVPLPLPIEPTEEQQKGSPESPPPIQ